MVWNKVSNINNIYFETYTKSYLSRSKHMLSVLKIFHTRMVHDDDNIACQSWSQTLLRQSVYIQLNCSVFKIYIPILLVAVIVIHLKLV